MLTLESFVTSFLVFLLLQVDLAGPTGIDVDTPETDFCDGDAVSNQPLHWAAASVGDAPALPAAPMRRRRAAAEEEDHAAEPYLAAAEDSSNWVARFCP